MCFLRAYSCLKALGFKRGCTGQWRRLLAWGTLVPILNPNLDVLVIRGALGVKRKFKSLLGKSSAREGLAVSRASSQVCSFTGVHLHNFFKAIAMNPCVYSCILPINKARKFYRAPVVALLACCWGIPTFARLKP